jgi:hypothetical protein
MTAPSDDNCGVQVVWGPLLAVLSMGTETTEDPKVVELCVEGFKHAIHCAGVLSMDTERAALVTALCNFTTLEPAGGGVRASWLRPQFLAVGSCSPLFALSA